MNKEEIENVLNLKEIDKNLLKARKNGLLLTDNQISTLNKYNIDSSNCKSMSELLYKIEQTNNGSYEEDYSELDYLAEQLAERNYYENIRK